MDRQTKEVHIDFDIDKVEQHHSEWKLQILALQPDEVRILRPAWTFEKLEDVIRRKISNLIIVVAEVRKIDDKEEFLYSEAKLLRKPSLDRFISAIEHDIVLVDFDARTGHNHGTKFRIRQDGWTTLYEEQTVLL